MVPPVGIAGSRAAPMGGKGRRTFGVGITRSGMCGKGCRIVGDCRVDGIVS
jgi:hypothetical protein